MDAAPGFYGDQTLSPAQTAPMESPTLPYDDDEDDDGPIVISI